MSTEPSDNQVIATGSVEGLYAFLDFLTEKGYATRSAVNPWRSASRQIFGVVEGRPDPAVDVTKIDPDAYMDRFEKLTVGQYKHESLASYRSRFKKAVEAYAAYLSDRKIPSFRGSGGPGGRKKETQAAPKEGTAPVAAHHVRPEVVSSAAEAGLIAYPFPLKSGELAYIRLPAKLDKTDADRLSAFIQTLVLEPQRQLVSG